MKKGDTFEDKNIDIDNLMIDMNGIFHNSAQKIYKYGNHKQPPRLLSNKRSLPKLGLKQQVMCFEDICNTIEMLLNIVKPNKRIVLCTDGPAPVSKQAQQRSRRFRSANEREDENLFDSCCITPGTKFMDFLSKYIDWYIRKRISEDETWKHIEVVYSSDKVPGEGEQKVLQFIRLHGNMNESYCIHGADADLIMLSLGTHYPKFYILRDDMMRYGDNLFFAINIGSARTDLAELLRWSDGDDYDTKSAINDFILMCFMVGNDFLPHIPCIEIIQGGIDTMIDIYKEVGCSYGHLTEYRIGKVRMVKKSLEIFIGTLSHHEQTILEDKLERRADFFPDILLDSNSVQKNTGKFELNIEKYRKDYYDANLNGTDLKQICHEYLEGVQWVLTYYTSGVPNWKWCYPYHYAPFAHTLVNNVKTFRFPLYGLTRPITPFIQLLSVLPPKSANLIPFPLCKLLTNNKSPLKKYCPDNFKIDISGKRQEWEGTVILPLIDYNTVEKCYYQYYPKVDPIDQKRNILGKSFLYTHNPEHSFLFKSFYGDFDCTVRVSVIDL
jgi:5'-3' exoribonuclease 1